MSSIFFEFIGYIAGICTAVCFLPQTVKTITAKNVKGLSSLSYLIYTIGILCWIIYGFYLGSTQMIIFNGISIIFSGTILYMIIRYRNKSDKMSYIPKRKNPNLSLRAQRGNPIKP